MRLTLTVELDPVEHVPGQPSSATVSLRTGRGVADLVEAASVEAANPHLPPDWSDCTPAMIACRVLAAGLRVGTRVVIRQSSVSAAPVRVRPVGV